MRLIRPAASLVTAAALALTLSSAPASAAGEGDWTQYRYAPTKNANVSAGQDVFTGSIPTANEVRATPVVADGTIFVGNHGTGELQAFDLATGALRWQAQAPNWVHSEMIYSGGTVFVGFGNRFAGEDGNRGTGESGVLALDAGTGEILWRFDTPGEVMPTPALAGGALYAVTGDKHLYKLDPASGAELATVPLGHVVSMSSPAEESGVLYFGSGTPNPYTFFAYDTAAGDFAWTRHFGEFNRGLDDVPPAVAEGVVVTTANTALPPDIFGNPMEEHTIVAMDAATGEILWRDRLGAGPAPVNNRSGAPMIHGGKVFVGSPTTGTTYAYDLHTGQRLWNKYTGPVKAAPAASGGTVFVTTTTGDVLAVNADSGELTGRLHLDGALAPAGPVVVDDTYLVIPSQSHEVVITRIDQIPPASWGATGSLGSAGSLDNVGGYLGSAEGLVGSPS